MEGVCSVAAWPDADIVLHAIAGWAGFRPAVRALETAHVLALANKESLVVGGHILMRLMEAHGGLILPVDSEQSAIAQAMRSGRRQEVKRVVLTASGGPFRSMQQCDLQNVTPEQALRHPTWRMGKKITVDSATLMNKALEIVEARWLFGLRPEEIEVLIHPQSVIHGIVEFVDGSMIAQLSVPDMKLPIQYALTYPERMDGPVQSLDLAAIRSLELSKPDLNQFPALSLGYEVAQKGGSAGAVLNAANEVAVDAFLKGRLKFTDIVPAVREVLHRHSVVAEPSVDELEQADLWAREEMQTCF
jgi:1-deoxy-D-xylulose-5-phosphate reductoisomerase